MGGWWREGGRREEGRWERLASPGGSRGGMVEGGGVVSRVLAKERERD